MSSYSEIEIKTRHVPLIANVSLRLIIGFCLLVLSSVVTASFFGRGGLAFTILTLAASWIPAVLLTDKYVHKYPQRYLSYLLASHLKAAGVMALFMGIAWWAVGQARLPGQVLWSSFALFVLADGLLSSFQKKAEPSKYFKKGIQAADNAPIIAKANGDQNTGGSVPVGLDLKAIFSSLKGRCDGELLNFIKDYITDCPGGLSEVLTLDKTSLAEGQSLSGRLGLLIARVPINNLRRINRFFLSWGQKLGQGGYFIGCYTPHEIVARRLKERYKGPLYQPVFVLHFLFRRAWPKIPGINRLYFGLTKGRGRVLSRVEVWGRLSSCGFSVAAETELNGLVWFVAHKVSAPAQNKRPSYYPVVALQKVGLDGEIIRTHKVRTMYPFSEFLQKQLFEDNGLASTGKFANDFRLTEYGPFLRKYWLDELPQVWDWLRGDIKLVGIRPTSPHFLSLYNDHFYNLYIQIKPGFISPIFDDATDGFDQIVEIELNYLESYWQKPFRTDVRCFTETFKDIVFKGVRSK